MNLQEVEGQLREAILQDTIRTRDELTEGWRRVARAADDALMLPPENGDTPGLLTLKYVPAQNRRYYPAGGDVTVSEGAPLTWGRATYVTPITEPFSTVPYGRAGIGIWLTLNPVRIFDARQAANRTLFSHWARYHYPYSTLMNTIHSNEVATEIRDHFSERFQLTSIAFHPDDGALGYTRARDTWLAVYPSESAGLTGGGTLRTNDRLSNPRHVVIAEEDFSPNPWPKSRVASFAMRSSFHKMAKSSQIALAYSGARGIVRIQA